MRGGASFGGSGSARSPFPSNNTTSNRKRSMPGHPWRLKPDSGKFKKPKPIIEKSVYVWLLDFPNEEEARNEEYGFTDLIILKEFFV